MFRAQSCCRGLPQVKAGINFGRILQQHQQQQQKEQFVSPEALRSAEPQALSSTAAQQTSTAGYTQEQNSGGKQSRFPGASSSIDRQSGLPRQAQNQSHSREHFRWHNASSYTAQPHPNAIRRPQNNWRDSSHRSQTDVDRSQGKLTQATAQGRVYQSSNQKPFTSVQSAQQDAARLSQEGNSTHQRKVQQREQYQWPGGDNGSSDVYRLPLSQSTHEERQKTLRSSAAPANSGGYATARSLSEGTPSSSTSYQDAANNFRRRTNTFDWTPNQSVLPTRLAQRGSAASSAAASHSAASRVLASGPALQDIETELDLRSDVDSQQSARVLAEDDFPADFSEELGPDWGGANGSGRVTVEEQRVEELKARLMEAVMPDVHVVDTVEDARTVSQLLTNDYRHKEFACDTEVDSFTGAAQKIFLMQLHCMTPAI